MLVALLLAGLYAAMGRSATQAPNAAPAVAIQTAQATVQRVPITVHAVGNVVGL